MLQAFQTNVAGFYSTRLILGYIEPINSSRNTKLTNRTDFAKLVSYLPHFSPLLNGTNEKKRARDLPGSSPETSLHQLRLD